MAKWILTYKTPLLCDMKRIKIQTTVYKTNVVLMIFYGTNIIIFVN
jgi:hypothetical protein